MKLKTGLLSRGRSFSQSKILIFFLLHYKTIETDSASSIKKSLFLNLQQKSVVKIVTDELILNTGDLAWLYLFCHGS